MALENGKPTSGKEPLKARIFISYSRKDLTFADRLEAGLKTRGFDTAIDRSEIYALEDWWKRIETLIAQADNIVFVLSPDAVASDVCQREVAFAASLNKRLAPVVHRYVDDQAVPEALARLNFIFFDDETRFDGSLNQLAEALATDIHWVRKHTEFGEHARRWAAAGRPGPRGLLLRSPMLEEAERWIASRPEGAPPPTEEAQAFIAESRRAATQRRNIFSGSLAVGLLMALALAGLAYWQRGIAVEQRAVAEGRRVASLAQLGTGERLLGNWDAALQLGVHAARLSMAPGLDHGVVAAPRAALATTIWQLGWRLMLNEHEQSSSRVAFSPDGTRIVTSFDENARIWDATTGSQIAVWPVPGGARDLIFSRDGSRIITTDAFGKVDVWNAATLKKLVTLQATQEGLAVLESVAFSPDGTRIVTGSTDKTARVWDASTAKEIAVLQHEAAVMSAAFNKDGTRIFAVSADGSVHIWDAVSAQKIAVVGKAELTVIFAVLSWDATRVIIVSNDSHFSNPYAPSLVRVSDQKTFRILDTATGSEIAILSGRKDIENAAFSPDGTRIVTGSTDKTARILSAATGNEIAVLRGHKDRVYTAKFSPDGTRIVTGSDDQTVRIWDTPNSTEIGVLRGHADEIASANFDPNGRQIVTASDDKTARIWDAGTGKEIAVLNGHEGAVNSGAFNPQGTRIVTASADKTARIWDAGTGKEIAVLRGHKQNVNTAAFSPDGTRIVTASDDRTVRIWDAETTNEIAVIQQQGSSSYVGATSASYSFDGRRIVTSSWDEATLICARIWDAATGKKIAEFVGHNYLVNSAAFSPDGTQIVTASEDGTARIWDAATGKELIVLKDHDMPLFHTGGSLENSVRSAVFSADGTRVLTASADGSARIWDVATGDVIALLRSNDGPLRSAAFSPDGTEVVTASNDKTARIHDVHVATMSTKNLIAEVCALRLRGLTTLSRDDMRLAGYSDVTSQIDVCAGIE